MTVKSILECERKSLEKMKKYQLPNQFRKIGFAILIISFASLFINKFSINNIEFTLIAKYGMLVGLLIVSISKEKIEDELISNLRMQSYTFAFIFGVVITLTNPFFSYIVDFFIKAKESSTNGVGDWQILWLLLSIQVFYFEFLKKLHR
jgi:hypothetical protein